MKKNLLFNLFIVFFIIGIVTVLITCKLTVKMVCYDYEKELNYAYGSLQT